MSTHLPGSRGLSRRTFNIALASQLAAARALCAQPAPWPQRAVTFVSPVAVGGSTDRLGRAITNGLAEVWRQPAVVDSRPGAGGAIAAAMVARAEPDGYTALFAQVSLVQAPHLQQGLQYSLQDFAGVSLLGTVPVLLAVGAQSPYQTLADYLQAGKRASPPVRFGSFGVGSSFHIYGETLVRDSGARLEHVAYKGEAAAVADVLGGHIESTFVSVSTALPLIKAGKLRALAVVGQPVSSLPGIPSFSSQGFPRLDVRGWFGIVVPRKVPSAIREKMASDMRTVATRPDVVEAFGAMSGDLLALDAQQTDNFLAQENEKWRKLITELGIKA
ncbi:MAG TPA: tripartite tricarboxylate transporter substrate binding protein [Burkholderiaceae bacterium]|nr:tripartite tricarboxylate transporter substrate binding protein [Burkholderiaceae bacterium]